MTPGAKAIVVYNGKILLALRDDKPDIPNPGKWDWPGGGCEEGETMEDTIRREIEEEYGIKPSKAVSLGVESFNGRQAGRFIVYLTEEDYQQIKFGDEGQKYGFYTFDQTMKMDLITNLKNFMMRNEEVLRKAIEEDQPINADQVTLEQT